MLMPRKVKHRKVQRGGAIRGVATKGNEISFGSFGLKAMESLQEINPDKDKASDAQIMFMCLHAS